MIVLTYKGPASVNGEFRALDALQPRNGLSFRTGTRGETKQDFRWADEILYIDSDKR